MFHSKVGYDESRANKITWGNSEFIYVNQKTKFEIQDWMAENNIQCPADLFHVRFTFDDYISFADESDMLLFNLRWG